MSNTTIQLKKSTVNKLKTLKEEQHLASYDEVIEKLLIIDQNVPESLFGVLRGQMKPFTRDYDDHDL